MDAGSRGVRVQTSIFGTGSSIEWLDGPSPAVVALIRAAEAVLACGVGNLSQPKYAARVAAFDALDDALDAFREDSDGRR